VEEAEFDLTSSTAQPQPASGTGSVDNRLWVAAFCATVVRAESSACGGRLGNGRYGRDSDYPKGIRAASGGAAAQSTGYHPDRQC
jgi:hypothetical protein